MEATIPCVCVGQPHATDTVTFRERLDFRRAASIKGDVIVMKLDNPDSTAGETLAVLSEGYLRQGIESWSLVGEDGKPLPVTGPNIEARILADVDVAMQLADIGDDLYAEAVMRPLLRSASPSLPATPTEPSTSPEPSPSETTASRSTSPILLPQPSKRSSTSTSRTAGTVPTTASRAGDSSSSLSSTSAP